MGYILELLESFLTHEERGCPGFETNIETNIFETNIEEIWNLSLSTSLPHPPPLPFLPSSANSDEPLSLIRMTQLCKLISYFKKADSSFSVSCS